MFGAGDCAGYFGGNVTCRNLCAANLTCSSDAGLKQDVLGLGYGLADLMRLRPVRWSWIDRTQTQLSMGLIAQEVEGVIPELVLRDANPAKPPGLNYAGLTPIMIKAIQDQQDLIAALQADNATLTADSATLKADNATLKAANQTLQQQQGALDARLAALEQRLQRATAER